MPHELVDLLKGRFYPKEKPTIGRSASQLALGSQLSNLSYKSENRPINSQLSASGVHTANTVAKPPACQPSDPTADEEVGDDDIEEGSDEDEFDLHLDTENFTWSDGFENPAPEKELERAGGTSFKATEEEANTVLSEVPIKQKQLRQKICDYFKKTPKKDSAANLAPNDLNSVNKARKLNKSEMSSDIKSDFGQLNSSTDIIKVADNQEESIRTQNKQNSFYKHGQSLMEPGMIHELNELHLTESATAQRKSLNVRIPRERELLAKRTQNNSTSFQHSGQMLKPILTEGAHMKVNRRADLISESAQHGFHNPGRSVANNTLPSAQSGVGNYPGSNLEMLRPILTDAGCRWRRDDAYHHNQRNPVLEQQLPKEIANHSQGGSFASLDDDHHSPDSSNMSLISGEIKKHASREETPMSNQMTSSSHEYRPRKILTDPGIHSSQSVRNSKLGGPRQRNPEKEQSEGTSVNKDALKPYVADQSPNHENLPLKRILTDSSQSKQNSKHKDNHQWRKSTNEVTRYPKDELSGSATGVNGNVLKREQSQQNRANSRGGSSCNSQAHGSIVANPYSHAQTTMNKVVTQKRAKAIVDDWKPDFKHVEEYSNAQSSNDTHNMQHMSRKTGGQNPAAEDISFDSEGSSPEASNLNKKRPSLARKTVKNNPESKDVEDLDAESFNDDPNMQNNPRQTGSQNPAAEDSKSFDSEDGFSEASSAYKKQARLTTKTEQNKCADNNSQKSENMKAKNGQLAQESGLELRRSTRLSSKGTKSNFIDNSSSEEYDWDPERLEHNFSSSDCEKSDGKPETMKAKAPGLQPSSQTLPGQVSASIQNFGVQVQWSKAVPKNYGNCSQLSSGSKKIKKSESASQGRSPLLQDVSSQREAEAAVRHLPGIQIQRSKPIKNAVRSDTSLPAPVGFNISQDKVAKAKSAPRQKNSSIQESFASQKTDPSNQELKSYQGPGQSSRQDALAPSVRHLPGIQVKPSQKTYRCRRSPTPELSESELQSADFNESEPTDEHRGGKTPVTPQQQLPTDDATSSLQNLVERSDDTALPLQNHTGQGIDNYVSDHSQSQPEQDESEWKNSDEESHYGMGGIDDYTPEPKPAPDNGMNDQSSASKHLLKIKQPNIQINTSKFKGGSQHKQNLTNFGANSHLRLKSSNKPTHPNSLRGNNDDTGENSNKNDSFDSLDRPDLLDNRNQDTSLSDASSGRSVPAKRPKNPPMKSTKSKNSKKGNPPGSASLSKEYPGASGSQQNGSGSLNITGRPMISLTKKGSGNSGKTSPKNIQVQTANPPGLPSFQESFPLVPSAHLGRLSQNETEEYTSMNQEVHAALESTLRPSMPVATALEVQASNALRLPSLQESFPTVPSTHLERSSKNKPEDHASMNRDMRTVQDTLRPSVPADPASKKTYLLACDTDSNDSFNVMRRRKDDEPHTVIPESDDSSSYQMADVFPAEYEESPPRPLAPVAIAEGGLVDMTPEKSYVELESGEKTYTNLDAPRIPKFPPKSKSKSSRTPKSAHQGDFPNEGLQGSQRDMFQCVLCPERFGSAGELHAHAAAEGHIVCSLSASCAGLRFDSPAALAQHRSLDHQQLNQPMLALQGPAAQVEKSPQDFEGYPPTQANSHSLSSDSNGLKMGSQRSAAPLPLAAPSVPNLPSGIQVLKRPAPSSEAADSPNKLSKGGNGIPRLPGGITLVKSQPDPPLKNQMADILASRGITMVSKKVVSGSQQNLNQSVSIQPASPVKRLPNLPAGISISSSQPPSASSSNAQRFTVPPAPARGRQVTNMGTVDLTRSNTNQTQGARVLMAPPSRSATCTICDKVFRGPESLQAHMAVHGGQVPRGRFMCEICRVVYPNGAKLAHHKQTVHPRPASAEATGPEFVIPICDVSQIGVKQKLLQCGIRHIVQLSSLRNANDTATFGLPIIPIDLARNEAFSRLDDLGASNILSLGTLKSVSR